MLEYDSRPWSGYVKAVDEEISLVKSDDSLRSREDIIVFMYSTYDSRAGRIWKGMWSSMGLVLASLSAVVCTGDEIGGGRAFLHRGSIIEAFQKLW
jgi:hypothetical protein